MGSYSTAHGKYVQSLGIERDGRYNEKRNIYIYIYTHIYIYICDWVTLQCETSRYDDLHLEVTLATYRYAKIFHFLHQQILSLFVQGMKNHPGSSFIFP